MRVNPELSAHHPDRQLRRTTTLASQRSMDLIIGRNCRGLFILPSCGKMAQKVKMHMMKFFLVGGAVRDRLLGLPVTERDWVVVGGRPDLLLAQGFRQVGKDFPVFLHPQTQEEYALARTERKDGHGYGGFRVDFAEDVSLEEDLLRRDLTINAIAEDDQGTLIDPYGGQADIDARLLRHVSRAFVEDPLRVLRVARFAARFHPLGFRIAKQTLALMQEISASGELEWLTAERIWKETERALLLPHPAIYFEVLRECGALCVLFPEIDALFGVPQRPEYHPEIDSGVHTLMTLTQSAALSDKLTVRCAALLHDLGKGLTPQEQWPRHIAHEERGVSLVNSLCNRLRVPRDCRELSEMVCRYHLICHRIQELRPETLLKKLKALDALRRPPRFEEFLLACEADARGRLGKEKEDYPQANYFRCARDIAASIDVAAIREQGIEGQALAQALDKARLKALHDWQEENT